MVFQYCSDLHLELLKDKSEEGFIKWLETKIEPTADFLILAGDIGHAHRKSYSFLLNWCSVHFQKTFIVMGNHEYYTTNSMVKANMHTMEKIELAFRQLCNQWKNVFLLQKNRVDFLHNGTIYTILGCTLWAQIPPEHYATMLFSMNDYSQIYKSESKAKPTTGFRTETECAKITPKDINDLHNDHKRWLFNELDEVWSEISSKSIDKPDNLYSDELAFGKSQRQVIVVTHHAPSLRLDNTDEGGRKLPCGYCTDMEHLIGSYVNVWISGHTHEVKQLVTKDNTRLLSNCIGYSTQKTGYAKDATFNFD